MVYLRNNKYSKHVNSILFALEPWNSTSLFPYTLWTIVSMDSKKKRRAESN